MVTIPLASQITENCPNDLLTKLLILRLVVRVTEHFVARLEADLSVSLIELVLIFIELFIHHRFFTFLRVVLLAG